ncbi:hypothetical protein F5Y17DRAFT_418698 [Xylariaceae sp. FL0594]|nr:hypothetical protein F5Y17DRAFT_418698 [Xylariaceae sp. FL0594]
MASQHVVFAETIMAMKKARKRRAYESDSDSEIDYCGNRGQKLKKKARFAHEGQLAPLSGPEVYREIVNHAGYQRAIISRNPPLLDDEGYEIDSDDDEEQIADAMSTAAEFNPYANIRLENILAPLTAITDLPTHPTLSRPYTSKTLTELTKQGCSIMHKENAALWKVKHLQTKLIGDHDWVPCEMMLGPNDIEFFDDDHGVEPPESIKPDGRVAPEHTQNKVKANGRFLENGLHKPPDGPGTGNKADAFDREDGQGDRTEQAGTASSTQPQSNGLVLDADAAQQNSVNGSSAANGPIINGSARSNEPDTSITQNTDMRGEAAARAAHESSGPKSLVSDSPSELPIHPMFIAPRSARPDRDLGIPENEAEEMRRFLQLYVQKQEEVCRGVKRLYEGLLRADRMRKTVFQWSKYEAHAGPNRDMSDGEDWYDKEEWGLEEDLKKGQDEEEDEVPQTTKKTRTRR